MDLPHFGTYALIGGLVVLGGLASGLTIGLLSLDKTTLQILKTTGNPSEREYARKIEPIRKKEYVLLTTLLIANTTINETLPILLDRTVGSGWQAILGSTLLLLIFGELIPQVVCTRYGLQIGAIFVWPLRVIMFILYPITWPVSKIIEKLMGNPSGTMYGKQELSELFTILTKDKVLTVKETRLLHGALHFAEKRIDRIYTELDQVFMLSVDDVLDRNTFAKIVVSGHSRIPIYKDNRFNIKGMLLTKRLIVLDAEDEVSISKLNLYPLKSFHRNETCFSVFHRLKKGTGMLALVNDDEDKPCGIVTLEDCLEALLEDEIVDETDTYDDTHSNRRNSVLYKPWYTSPFVASKIPSPYKAHFHPIQDTEEEA